MNTKEAMDIYDYLAILGACAWIPSLIGLIIKIITKPRLNIIVHKQIELGYTTNGSIMNLSMALSSENSECLVTNIEVEITGPNKQQHLLKWEWFEEKLYEMDYPELGSTPVRKQQNAIAIKILKESLIEKKIGFHDVNFKEEYSSKFSSVNESYNNLSQNNLEIEQLKSTKEYNDFKNLLNSSCFWKEGIYKGTIKVCALNLIEPFKKEIDFKLTGIDNRRIQTNIKTCEEVLENHYFPVGKEYHDQWNWVYPNTIEK